MSGQIEIVASGVRQYPNLKPFPCIDITGQSFGQLTAIKRDPNRAGKQNTFWRCLCTCGSETVVRLKDLQSSNTRSCGCLANRFEVNRDNLSARQIFLLELAKRQEGTSAVVSGRLVTITSNSAYKNLERLRVRGLLDRKKLAHTFIYRTTKKGSRLLSRAMGSDKPLSQDHSA